MNGDSRTRKAISPTNHCSGFLANECMQVKHIDHSDISEFLPGLSTKSYQAVIHTVNPRIACKSLTRRTVIYSHSTVLVFRDWDHSYYCSITSNEKFWEPATFLPTGSQPLLPTSLFPAGGSGKLGFLLSWQTTRQTIAT